MIKSFIRSVEDPKRPFLGPTYWILQKVGLVLPENDYGKFIYILIHTIVTVFVMTQFVELYIIRSNLDHVLTNLKISMLSVVCVVKANTFVFWQNSWKDLFNYIITSDEVETAANDPRRTKIVESYTRYCRRITYNYWVLVFLTFITTIGNPLMGYISSASYREELRNGTELFPHIFSSWMPLDKYHSPGCWVTVIWHILLCFYGAMILASYDTNSMVIMVYFGGKLELMRERCKHVIRDDETSVSDEEFCERIGELHNSHVMYMRYLRLFDSMLSPVMFLYVVICSVMLCASTYQLTIQKNAAQKLVMAEYLIFGVAQLFIYCWHSNDVLVKNQQVVLGPYESRWWTTSVRQRKSIILLAGQLQINQMFSAGPFTNLTLSTFLTIMKGAYSYYTLIRK